MMARKRRPLPDFLTYLPVACLARVAGWLPYRSRLALGAAVGRGAVRLPRYRRRIAANLAHVFPEMPEAERSAVARQTGENFGRTFIETLRNADFHRHAALRGPVGPGAAALASVLERRGGAVLVTGHFGQWEAVRAIFTAQGIACAGIYRPIDNPRIDALYVAGLEAGGPVYPKGRTGLRGLVSHLSRGGVAGILVDQYDNRGATLDFLGQPAPTMLTAAELALKYRLPLIPTYGVRQPDGEGVEIFADLPVPVGTAREMMQAVNDSLAAIVRRYPGQYYWLHRRWEKTLAP